MKKPPCNEKTCTEKRRTRGAAIAGVFCLWLATGAPAQQSAQQPAPQQAPPAQQPKPAAADASARPAAAAPSLDELRLTMGKWIETQQIIAKERKDWQQGKELLVSRLELKKKEIAELEDKIGKAQASVAEAAKKRDELLAANAALVESQGKLTKSVIEIEGSLKQLLPTLPDPLQSRMQQLVQRMPADAANTRVGTAERFQNALGMLGEIDKADADLSVAVEVRTLPNGKRAEVQSLYLGLAQAYYLSADGDAGIGKPGKDGWHWEVAPTLARDLVVAFEILQGKRSPAFVNLPVVLQ
jgi:hypothetical protein